MYYIILNPVSKSGRGIQIWKALEPVFLAKEIPYKLLRSKRQGGISALVKSILQKQPADSAPVNVILLGGDGTLNEALQGVTDFSRINFGYIPTGSSNDFARDLKLPKDPRKLLERILSNSANGKVRLLDLGVLQYADTDSAPTPHYFAVSEGIGFDAAVCEEVISSPLKKQLNRFKLGKLTYVMIALKQLIRAKSVSCDLTLDEQQNIHLDCFLFIAAMVHRYEGGGFMFAPEADATDGMLNLCVVGRIPKPVILVALPTAYWGKHYIFPNIEHYMTSKLELRTSVPLWVHTDGEVHTRSSHIIVSCKRQALRLLL